MSLSFLNNITVAAAAVKETSTKGRVSKKQRQPDTADLRVWKDGSVYPSNALIAEFDLEYRKKDSDKKGFGFDIANVLSMSNQISGATQDFLIIAAVDRDQVKVDLFGTCTFNKETLEPLAAVAEQGAFSYGESTLLPLLAATYNAVPNEEGYIDLSFVRASPIQSPNGIFLVPKKVTRSERAGEIEYKRREGSTFYPLVPTSTLPETPKEEAGQEAVSTTTSATAIEGEVIASEESGYGNTSYDGTVALDNAEKADPIDYSQPEYDHKVTQEDLDNNAPYLAAAGVNVGDTISISPEPSSTTQEDPFN